MIPSSYNRRQKPEDELYNHLMHWVKVESPDRVIQRFHSLFADSKNYPDPSIQAALDQIATTNSADDDFKFIFNRCCYILINNWRNNPAMQWAVSDLISVLENFSHESYASSAQRLHQLLCYFIHSDEYEQLQQRCAQSGYDGGLGNKRTASVSQRPGDDVADFECDPYDGAPRSAELAQPLHTLVHRYPFLYEHYLVKPSHTPEQRQVMRQKQIDVQQKFTDDLYGYYLHRVKSHPRTTFKQPPQNPTLLSDEELHVSLQHFSGKVHHNRTYREVAADFLSQSRSAPNFRVFKDDLYEYLVSTIAPYGNHSFHEKLRSHLRNAMPQNDVQRPSDALTATICQKLFDFLVIESSRNCDHRFFLDLFSNVGVTGLIGLLLKIVLLCRQTRVALERRFVVLFNHLSNKPRHEVNWLVKSLDNLSVAFCMHFDHPDFLQT